MEASEADLCFHKQTLVFFMMSSGLLYSAALSSTCASISAICKKCFHLPVGCEIFKARGMFTLKPAASGLPSLIRISVCEVCSAKSSFGKSIRRGEEFGDIAGDLAMRVVNSS